MHNIYSYHAKFTPEIPNYLISKYSEKGHMILDPFCGCGTTLLEGIKLGRNVIGVDLNPIGVLCSKVKTKAYILDDIKSNFSKVVSLNTDNVLIPEFPKQNIWYTKNVLLQLGMLNYNIQQLHTAKYRDLFLLILLSILNSCSRKRKTWNLGYLADNVLPNEDRNVDVLKLYINKVQQLIRRNDFLSEVSTEVRCVESDILKCKNINDVDLVVTSPPYPFAVDFIRYHRLALYWLGKPVEELSEKEVGARNKRNKKDAIFSFFHDMDKIYCHVMKMVKYNGYWCMTIGDTTRQKEKIDFIEWSINLFQSRGWKLISHNNNVF